MPTWRPATRDEVQAIVAVQQQALSDEQRELFDQIRIEPSACQIELTSPDGDGVLRDYGASQFELRHVLNQVRDHLG
jgi:hypothetical protein